MKIELPPLALADLPAALPDDPKGWGKRLDVHYNYGPKGGAAVSSVYNPEGRRAPIQYQYDTRKQAESETGFVIRWEGKFYGKVVPTWRMLQDEWKEFIAAVRPA